MLCPGNAAARPHGVVCVVPYFASFVSPWPFTFSAIWNGTLRGCSLRFAPSLIVVLWFPPRAVGGSRDAAGDVYVSAAQGPARVHAASVGSPARPTAAAPAVGVVC